MQKQINNKSLVSFIVLAAVILLMVSCSNNETIYPCLEGKTYNFWSGLWHGIIAPINWIAMFFREDVNVYAPNNTGAWYALGFLIGSGGWGFLGGKGVAGKKN